jgi:uncharacterized sporulation protein YeaH/YhbH (DUF444 family)
MDSDLGRFKNIVKGKVRQDMKRFVSSNNFNASVAGKIIKVPLSDIDLPKFSFGQNGGAGSGPGEIGDGLGDGSGKNGKGKGKASDGSQDGGFGVEFTPEELSQLMIDHLELPDLSPKGSGKVDSKKSKYNQINPQGVIKHFRKTYNQALKRQMSSGSYDPVNPLITPIRSDQRYKTASVIDTPDVNCFIAYIIDISGSMQLEQKNWARNITFWTDTLLKHYYKNIAVAFFTHDTMCKEVEREQFFTAEAAGGTRISSAYTKVAEHIEQNYPFSDYNNYVFHFSDADNLSDADNQLCGQILNEKLLPNCNAFNFCETKSPHGGGDFMRYLEENFLNNDKLQTATIEAADGTLGVIKTFFEKGK